MNERITKRRCGAGNPACGRFSGGHRLLQDGGSRGALWARLPHNAGLTLIELVVAFTIMLVLTSMAVPLARAKIRVERERELRADLREMRNAIDKYKDYCDAGYLGPMKAGTDCWPESLDQLVKGIKLPTSAEGKIIKFLRRVPKDPFTNSTEWGLRSDQDDPKSTSWGGQNVFDVYTKTDEQASDGTPYSEF